MKKFILSIAMLASVQVVAAERTVVLSVPGMNCPVCPITVKKSLEGIKGVKTVKVSYEAKTATVRFDDQQVQPAQLMQATTNAGYPSKLK